MPHKSTDSQSPSSGSQAALAGHDDIAIVGMACRFPQEAENPTKFWELLLHGRSALTEVPDHKFNIDGHYHPDSGHGGSTSCRKGHFLKDSGYTFDAPFFNISKNEAMSMDPQQRLLMENVYEAIENAGIPVEAVSGTATSVFVGAFTNDFQTILNTDPEAPAKYAPTGNSNSILSNRVSWFYDLKGCSLTLDTACSSSLVATHLACENLRSGAAEMSIVGGVNVIEQPQALYRMSELGFLSPDGKCYSFDSRANGYSRGEGVGVVLLKPLRTALKDGNTIRAVIRASGVNQDGRTPGMTVPSKSAQEALIRSVYGSAGLDLADTDYVEAHGTGTALGDPIEAGAIGAAWKGRVSDSPLYVGAVKSGIGHLEGASGVAGIIKTVLALEKAVIPPNINFEEVNPKILVEEWNIKFPLEPTPWPNTHLRRASINSFGFGGTNAHVVIDDTYNYLRLFGLEGKHRTVTSSPSATELPLLAEDSDSIELDLGSELSNSHDAEINDTDESSDNGGGVQDGGDRSLLGLAELDPTKLSNGEGLTLTSSAANRYPANRYPAHNMATTRVFVFSSADQNGIKRMGETYTSFLANHPDILADGYLDDLAYTLCKKRTVFPWRSAVAASSRDGLLQALPSLARTARQVRPSNSNSAKIGLGFVFTGQGAQWSEMGRELLVYPAFRQSLEAASVSLQEMGCPWLLTDELLKDSKNSRIDQPDVSQATTTALQIALIDLLRTWDVRPTRVVGHSSGEIAAAYCSGALSREAAWRISYYRGVVAARLAGQGGAMIAVGTSEAVLQPYLDRINEDRDGELTIACYNSPMNLTISGHEKNIDKLAEMLEAEKIFCKRPNVLNAYHSSYMKPVADDYRELIGTISAPSSVEDNGNYGRAITMFSSVTGEEVQARLLQDAQYWVDNLLCPVRFSQSLLAMCSPASSKKPKLRVGRSTDTPLQHLVEIGPHPALQSAVPQILGQNVALSGIECHHLLRRRISGVETTLSTLAKLFSCGYPVDLIAVNHKSHQSEGEDFVQPQMLVDLPPYPFNHSQTYWPESRLSKNFRFRKHPRHDLLGATVPDWNVNDPKWRQIFRVSENPWLKHHKVTGRMVYPGVGYIIMAIEAARQLCEAQEAKVTGFCLRDIAIRSALQIPETEDGVEVMLSMPPATESSLLDSATWKQFKISSYNTGTREWTEHCRGMITVEMKSHPNPLSHTQADDKTETRQDEKAKLVEKCTVPFDMTRAYAELETIGLSFGPLFKNLSQVKRGGGLGEAVGQIIIPDIAATQPKNFTHPHIIHPATMDSMLHLVLAAIQDKNSQSRLSEPMVPVFIGEVWVAQDLSSRPGTIFHGHGTAQNVAHKKLRGSISIWDEESESKVRFSGIQFVQLQSSSAASQRRQLSFNIAWKPDVELFDPRECEKYLLATVKPIKLQIETVYRLAEAFNLASILYITEALRELQDIVVDDLPQHLQRYFAWMKHQDGMFRQDKILHQRSEWRMVLNSQTLREKLLAEVEKTGPEGRLTNRMGASIVPILRQEADALQLMFGDGLLDQYYRELHGTENIHQLIRSYIDLYSFKHGNLKILEIGAGTGGTTLPVLETLNPSDGNPRAVQYTYTDVSPGFFENAKAKFRPYLHIVEFRRLDIEKDPLTQGFDEGHYDMIIAANVLHATADISNTLTNARKLLRTGGVLLLQEAVNPALLSGPLAFGTLPGWWLGQEESRKLSPILDECQWGDALKESGFRGADLVLKDHSDQKIHGQSLIVATAHESSPLQQRSLASSSESVIIISSPSSSKLGVEVEKSLRSAGVSDVRILADDAALAGTDFKKCVCIVLRELETSIFKDISGEDFENMRKLLTTCKDLVWVTGNTITNPDLGLSTGLIRSIRWERDLDGSNLVTIAFDSVDSPPASMASQIARIFDYEFCRPSKQQHAEYRVDNQTISINRLTNAPYLDEYLSAKLNARVAQPQAIGSNPQRALKLGTDCPGLLNKLQFVDCPVYPTSLGPHDVEVSIAATGLNFRDVMCAMGEVAGDVLGAEGAGTVTRTGTEVSGVAVGDRVALLASYTGCFATHARTVDKAVVSLPDNVAFEEAAGMPVITCTAYYSLVDLARLRKGESVLIHAAAGGVGQAAIMLAQHLGAEIFATVSTEEKKKLLVETYGIVEDHVLYSRDLSFGKDVMRLTKGRGVDVVLNSLAGEALRVSWNCVAPFGRFVEIGKRDIYSNGRLDMFPFSKNITFASCDLETVMKLDQPLMARLLQDTMRLWSHGVFRQTTPLNVFPYSNIESSFRLLQSGKHIGKIVLTSAKDDVVPVVPPPIPDYRFPEEASYVLAGGLGGLGRSIAKWMASRGARHFIFLSRSGSESEAAQALLKELEAEGCQTAAFACDVSNADLLQKAIAECASTMPPIRGCIQGAMQLKDSAFETMSHSDFTAALRPKVHGSFNLHKTLPENLDFFIMLSSICGLIGNRGQSNYAAGNTYQDSLAHFRRQHGQAATTIDLGSMLSVGFIAEHAQTVNPYALAAEAIREDEFHAMLEYHIDPQYKNSPAQVAVGLATKAAFAKKGIPEPSFLRHPLFTLLQCSSSESDSTDGESEAFAALRTALRAAKSAEEAVTLVVEMLVQRLSSVMALPAEDIDSSKPIHFYGVDSLVAVEFRNWLAKNLEAEIEVLDIMGDGSIVQLSEKIVTSSKMLAFGAGSVDQS